jgi:hypothetical protein
MMSDPAWRSEFRERMESFDARHPGAGVPISIKVRVVSGCFHREHSPHAYELIDQQLSTTPDYDLLEHESGPELLTWVTDGVSIATGVITAVVAIVQARRSGVERGDHPREPLELIVRRADNVDGVREETVLRLGSADSVDSEAIKALLEGAAVRFGRRDPN